MGAFVGGETSLRLKESYWRWTRIGCFSLVSVLLGSFASANGLEEKLGMRETINPFNSWQPDKGTSAYGLYWDNKSQSSNKTITLITPNWNYYYPNRGDNYPGIEKFLTDRPWNHDEEYGKTVAVDLLHPDFIPYFVELVGKLKKGSDGILLDWWHNYHHNGLSEAQMEKFRLNLLRSIRDSYGNDFVILGNVNWRKDSKTAPFLSGVYMELYKEPYEKSGDRLYTSSELKKIQGLIDFYQKNLGYPKIIALQGWRKTQSLTDADRNTSENRRIAMIFTAMSAVIPDNGYILYSDNNPDSPNGDHDHILYDFYDFDIGQPIKSAVRLSPTSRYREFEGGVIGYNIGSGAESLTVQGVELEISPGQAIFCRFGPSIPECLNG